MRIVCNFFRMCGGGFGYSGGGGGGGGVYCDY